MPICDISGSISRNELFVEIDKLRCEFKLLAELASRHSSAVEVGAGTSAVPALLLAMLDRDSTNLPPSFVGLRDRYEKYRKVLYMHHFSDVDKLIEEKLGIDSREKGVRDRSMIAVFKEVLDLLEDDNMTLDDAGLSEDFAGCKELIKEARAVIVTAELDVLPRCEACGR